MMMVPNIFRVPEPILGVPEPICGGARLPNDRRAFQKPTVDAALTCDRKRHVCRAVNPASATFPGPSFLIVARASGPTAAQPPSQRLGTFRGFDLMQARHPSGISGKPGSRSGASPHQSCDGSSPLMTNQIFSVPYFKPLIVSL
jgi:hypothetical protein